MTLCKICSLKIVIKEQLTRIIINDEKKNSNAFHPNVNNRSNVLKVERKILFFLLKKNKH